MNTARYELKLSAFFKERKIYLTIKRMFDLVFAILAGALLFAPMLIVAVLIKLDSPGPAIFTQKRVGKCGKEFTIYKFRTMYVGSPNNVAAYKLDGLKRYVTKTGAILRRTGIDELPQLWNIIRGDMSFVGYRPISTAEKSINERRLSAGVFVLRPGITGLAQINGRDDITEEEKVRCDAKYVSECSLKTDVYCLVKTVSAVISGRGAN